jgi:phosphoglycolate phosphatase-like HAD superfamily hydrolase
MPLAVIFDIDGTLVDTNYQHALAWFRAFRTHDLVMPIWQIHRAIGIGSDRVVEPEPDIVNAAVEKAGGGPAVMIGDSTWDCKAATRADLASIGVLTGGFSEQELREAGATVVFDSVEHLRQHLDGTSLQQTVGI